MSVLVLWIAAPCELQGINPEDRGSIFLRNVNIYIQVLTALQPRIPTLTVDFP
jgi:hypothetical protein